MAPPAKAFDRRLIRSGGQHRTSAAVEALALERAKLASHRDGMSLSDPMERMIADALRAAGVSFVEAGSKDNTSKLDFELPDLGLAIEVKRFHSERIGKQLGRYPNVLVAQGEPAVRALALMIRSGGLSAFIP